MPSVTPSLTAAARISTNCAAACLFIMVRVWFFFTPGGSVSCPTTYASYTSG